MLLSHKVACDRPWRDMNPRPLWMFYRRRGEEHKYHYGIAISTMGNPVRGYCTQDVLCKSMLGISICCGTLHLRAEVWPTLDHDAFKVSALDYVILKSRVSLWQV